MFKYIKKNGMNLYIVKIHDIIISLVKIKLFTINK